MAPKAKGPLDPFDESKLAELSEPITVTVHKVVNGRPCPISLPVKPEEDVPGKGWTKDEVRQLDEFLVKEWSGGGQYNNTATGDNGSQMRWQSYFPIDRYPEKPAPMTAAPPVVPPPPNNGHGPALSLGASPSLAVVPSTPVYTSPPGWMQFAAASAVPQLPPLPATQSSSPYSSPQYQQSPYQFYDPRRNDDDQLRQAREEFLKLEAKIERERLEAAYKEQLANMNQELRRIQDQMSARPSGETEESRALKAELAELRKERENDKVSTMIREIQQSTQQQIAALTTLVTQQQQNKGPDPLIMMLIELQKTQATAQLESARLQAEAQKEAARLQAEAQKEAARNAVGPREMIDIAAKFNTGHDQLAGAYTRLIEVSQQHFENLLSSQGPQVHPALEMVGQGMQGVLGVAQRYIEMKEQTLTTQARAAATAAQVQAQAQVAIAAQRGLAAPAESPDGRAPANVAPPADAEDEGEEEEEEDSDELEEMEKNLFGSALMAVKRLRTSVESGQVGPQEAAQALLQGIEYFGKKGEPIAAFELWKQNELAKLVDILIPDAPTSFKEQMIAMLFEVRKTMK